jgi:hypothetical protein
MMATNRFIWGPGWSEIHSHSYGFGEAQLQVCMDEPAPSRNDEVFSARQGPGSAATVAICYARKSSKIS